MEQKPITLSVNSATHNYFERSDSVMNEEKTCPNCNSQDIQTKTQEYKVMTNDTSGGGCSTVFKGIFGGNKKTSELQRVYFICRDCGKEFQ